MKSSSFRETLQFRSRSARFLAMGLLAISIPAQIRAEAVDTELLLLVDIVRPELSNRNFNRLMEGYAATFTSSQMMDSIQSGATGKIAAALMFYGGTNEQIIGVPWMSIGSPSDAATFASLLQAATRPRTFSYSDPGAALNATTASFGTETGGNSNGFESVTQIIEVASSGIPSNSMAASTAASRTNALASGVDLINTVALGLFSDEIQTFYSANVVGSTIPGVAPTVTASPLNGSLSAAIGALLITTTGTGAAVSITAVPEPSILTAFSAAALLFFRRRRD